MATETTRRMTGHIRSVTVTTLATVMGVIAALGSDALGYDPARTTALGLVAVSVVVQFPILKVVGVDMDDLSTKDYLYIAFMTFSLWFVSWSIILTTGSI